MKSAPHLALLCSLLAPVSSQAGTVTTVPLSLKNSAAPNIIFSLSVEFPTALTPAYQDNDQYSTNNTYLGYFDSEKCYTYNTTAKQFEPAAMATGHSCASSSGKWSGNFMNWATMTTLDEFRSAMTGGNRAVDTSTETVLERTYASDDGSAEEYFNVKTFTAAIAAQSTPFTSSGSIYNLKWSGPGGVEVTFGVDDGSGCACNQAKTTYRIRVKVCDSTVGVESNCTQYGSSYKPTGVLQTYGDRMRFGLFSYYNSTDIDNAVMRSRAKYLAPGSSSGSNGNPEWDAGTGVLTTNPDASTTAPYSSVAFTDSGVINYINKFGSINKNYKRYDPVSKLYYESLKYLRGLQPTNDFYRSATSSNSEGFPVISTWDDPIQNTCQKNFIFLMGDMNTWCDKRLPGGRYTATGTSQCDATTTQSADTGSLSGDTGLDVSTWTRNLWQAEGSSFTETSGPGYVSSGYITGMAYWAAYQDIRPDDNSKPGTIGKQTVQTWILDVEERKQPGIFNQYWYAAKYGGARSFDSSGRPLNSMHAISPAMDYWGTSVNEWPNTKLRGGDPVAMRSAIQGALSNIATQTLISDAGLTASSTDMRTGQSPLIFRTLFDPRNWSGEVQAYTLSTDGTLSSSPTWTASSKLPAWGSRRILSFNDGLTTTNAAEATSKSRRGIVFGSSNFSSDFSTRQKALLNTSESSITDTYGADRVDFIAGDRSKEAASTAGGHSWRSRASLLGDIVNSAAVYVGAPTPGILGKDTTATAAYNTFASGKKNRTPMLYAGGNDGMLHAFNASNTSTGGTETLAYVPSAIYPKLNQLMNGNYSHQFYVDSTPATGEACLNSCAAAGDWKTVLVGGLGAGGQGIYALDITDPSVFSSKSADETVLWEFTDRDDPDLGYTFSKPVIRLMNDGKWRAIVGSGFNNTATDGKASTSGVAYLFLLNIEGPGNGNTWTLNKDYYKIALPGEPSGNASVLNPPNGLASVAAVDKYLDGKIDTLYAGDIFGNLWKVDVSDTNPRQWASALTGTLHGNGGGNGNTTAVPLFSATDSSGTAQPITTGLEVTPHPKGGYLVMFGTGSFIFTEDPSSTQYQNMYGIWDKGDGTLVTRSSLQKQKVIASGTINDQTYYYLSRCKPNYTTSTVTSNQDSTYCPSDIAVTNSGQQLGWTFSFPNAGERVAYDKPLLQNGDLSITTLTPSTETCSGSVATRAYDLDYLTGGALTSPIYDINGDGVINSSDYQSVSIGSGAGASTVTLAPSGRLLTGQNAQNGIRITRPATASGTSTTTSCPDFIPGWGCPSRLSAANSSCSRWIVEVSTDEYLGSSGNNLKTVAKCQNIPAGRINWRQITR